MTRSEAVNFDYRSFFDNLAVSFNGKYKQYMDKSTNTDQSPNTVEQFRMIRELCRSIYEKKMLDYGTSWRIMRPSSLTDQIFIKAKRIRTLEDNGEDFAAVDEGIEPEFIGIINYCAMALIQLALGPGDPLPPDKALEMYDSEINAATSLMMNKNHDYDEAWRDMRVSSFTDIILQKLLRTKEIESHHGRTIVSEGIDANYMDMINYAFFALIKIRFK